MPDNTIWPVTLPYFRDLQVNLPTIEEIKNSTKTYKSNVKTVVLASGYIVKYGKFVQENEGQTLLFLEAHTTCPAPRLHAMFRDGEDVYLVMQHIPAQPLNELWPHLGDEDKDKITADLRSIFDDLRATACPWPTTFCGIDGGALPDHLFWSPTKDRKVCGPFHDHTSLVNSLVSTFRAACDGNRWPPYKADFYQRHLTFDSKAVFCHGDIQKKNILFANGQVTLIDWEAAGWYPEYWDYLMAVVTFEWTVDDWCSRLDQVLATQVPEMAMMKMLYHDLFF